MLFGWRRKEDWSDGVTECWSIGVIEQHPHAIAPFLHHSITPAVLPALHVRTCASAPNHLQAIRQPASHVCIKSSGETRRSTDLSVRMKCAGGLGKAGSTAKAEFSPRAARSGNRLAAWLKLPRP